MPGGKNYNDPWVHGVDLSHWQSTNVKFPFSTKYAFIKASQGRTFRDKDMKAHHARLRREGILVGPYHYYTYESTPQDNAANFLAATKGIDWQLPHVLDIEATTTAGKDKARRTHDLRVFMDAIEADTKRVPIFYTYKSWFDANLNPDSAFGRYPLWIARYPHAYANGTTLPSLGASTPVPKPWENKGWVVWQYSVAGNLDRNVTTAARLATISGGAAAPVTPPTPLPSPPSATKPILRVGSKGTLVKELQQSLNLVAGTKLKNDGIFGTATQTAVRNFQRFFKLHVDGIVGRDTWALLDYCVALKRAGK